MLRLLVLVVYCFFLARASTGACPNPNAVCEDCFSWCKEQKALCSESVIKNVCKQTCKTCPTNSPACIKKGCKQVCIQNADKTEATCSCLSGFQLDADGITCSDIDECKSNETRCRGHHNGEVCVNSQGSYQCSSCQAFNTDYWTYYNRPECCKHSTEVCGKSANNGRILKGVDSLISSWPWMAYITVKSQLCGGSLLSDRWVLSAGHCFTAISDQELDRITVVFGLTITVNDTTTHRKTRKVELLIRHPDYNDLKNDVALLRIKTAVNFGTFIRPVCLPGGEKPKVGEICYATGYGTTAYRGAAASQLQQVDLPIVDGSTCVQSFINASTKVNTTTMICAGYESGGKDACQGDSGGPLVCQRCENCDWYVAGVISFGQGCGVAGYYGVYTNINYFEDWIKDTIANLAPKKYATCTRASWSDWGDYTACSKTCNSGTQSRVRHCQGGIVGSVGCIGADLETRECNVNSCDATWTEWSNWTQCSQTCGGSSRSRSRSCQGDGTCDGLSSESASCGPERCPSWTLWNAWSACAVTCAGSTSKRSRTCKYGKPGDIGCHVGTFEEIKPCNTKPCPVWGPWSDWTNCPETCGSPDQFSLRTCQHGNVGQVGCQGLVSRKRKCATISCVENQWSEWSVCTKTCNSGTRTRSKDGVTQTRNCRTKECPYWSDYSDWSACSKSCGGGEQSSSRSCISGNVGQEGCLGKTSRTRACNLGLCPVWQSWGSWSSCSKTCGEGTRSQERGCDNGNVGQDSCIGPVKKTEDCNLGKCPSWKNWSAWGSCSVTCDGGKQISTRTCRDGTVGQKGCQGPTSREQVCSTGDCPVFTAWSEWSGCSVTCSSGTQTRTRSCPQPGLCPADIHILVTSQQQACSAGFCPWDNWGAYGACSVTCGTGTQTRTRVCSAGVGKCEGNNEEQQDCTQAACSPGDSCDSKVDSVGVPCATYVQSGYCTTTYQAYMQTNCAKACCLGQTQPQCTDFWPTTYCASPFLCGNPNLKQFCKKTCSLCTE